MLVENQKCFFHSRETAVSFWKAVFAKKLAKFLCKIQIFCPFFFFSPCFEQMHGFPWKVKVLFFSLMDFTVAVGLTAGQYYDFTQVFLMLLQKCWQLNRWADLGMDVPGNPLDSVRPKAHLKSFPSTHQDLRLITPYGYIALLRTSPGWGM